MDNYYTKYIKYKSKYLELKRITEKELVGGVVGELPCMLSILSTSIWDNLQRYNCNYEDINKKFPNEMLKLSYNDFLKNKGSGNKEIKVSDLKERGFPLSVLKEAEFPLSELKTAGFPLSELRKENVSLSELKDAGFSAIDLKKAGYNIYMLMCIFTNEELKKAGFTDDKNNPDRYLEIGRKVCNKKQLIELKKEGYTAIELKDWYPLDELINAGFTDEELKKAGFIEAVLDDQKLRMASIVKSSS